MSIRVWGSVRGLPVGAVFLFSLSIMLFFVTASAGSIGAQDGPSPTPSSDAVDSFVRAHRAVSTTKVEAQRAFDDGLTLLYAFNPEQARVSFHRVLELDPNCVFAWWGVAMSYGVNINTSFDADEQQHGHDAIAHAATATAGNSLTAVERALVRAAVARFANDRHADAADRSASAYRDAMYATASEFPADDDVQTLAAEAEMDVHSWSYFNPDGTPTAGTMGIVDRLQTVLARDPGHIGAEHLLIHALEESKHPEGALDAGRRLAADRFEPAAEHLIHMPAHVFMRVGLYHDAGEANARAVAAYKTYLAQSPPGHTDYLGHDCVFGVDAFLMSGEYAPARTLALACNRGRGGLLAIVDLRFHRYDMLAADENPTSLTTGLLAVHDGRAAVAEAQLATLRKDRDDVGRLSADLLAANIAASQGNRDAEIASLTQAVAIQDREGYSEPPEFWLPVGEELGAANFRAGRFEAAEAAFRSTLAHQRDDPRALFGLARTLEREGRTEDARTMDSRFQDAWRPADVTLDMNDL